MYRKLQHNFDVIRFLVQNASPEQLTWHSHEIGESLSNIICRLCDLEGQHIHFLEADQSDHEQAGSVVTGTAQKRPPSSYRQTLAEYARYRQQIIARLQGLIPSQGQQAALHEQFGRITIGELVKKIDEQDQFYLKQIEAIIHCMPLNPLLARALQEIRDYHERYRVHLLEATSVLDIGVGTGLALRHIMEQNPHLTFAGVDVRDLRLPEAQVPLQVYDGCTLPFPDNQFDVSLLFYVLHHCQSPGRLLAEAARATRQKLIIIEEFDRPGADPTSLDLTERQNHRALGLPPDLPYQLFDKQEFEMMLRAQHLIEIEQQPLPSKTTRPVQKYLYVVGRMPGSLK